MNMNDNEWIFNFVFGVAVYEYLVLLLLVGQPNIIVVGGEGEEMGMIIWWTYG